VYLEGIDPKLACYRTHFPLHGSSGTLLGKIGLERANMRSWMVFTLLSASLLLGQPAWAAKHQSRERQAKKACLSGDYTKGVAILSDLFLETNDATFLYNQGRCYEQNVRYVEAAERFREYLRKTTNLDSDVRADVDKHIAECEAAAAKDRPRNTASPEPAPMVTNLQQTATTPVGYTGPATTSRGTSYAVSATNDAEYPWQHTAKWIASGAAVAFLGLGIAEHLNYYSKNHDFNNDLKCTGVPDACKSLANSADTAQIVAIVGYSAAAVATGAAILFWLTDSPKTQPTQQSGIGFSCAPSLAGVACRGRF
jgi:hypothetical protein